MCPQMNVSRANCNKIIMLFTDAGEDRAQEIFEEYNFDKKVSRMFPVPCPPPAEVRSCHQQVYISVKMINMSHYQT